MPGAELQEIEGDEYREKNASQSTRQSRDVPVGDPAMGGHAGFALGLALALYNEVTIEEADRVSVAVEGEGSGRLAFAARARGRSVRDVHAQPVVITELLRDALGEHVHEFLIRNKREEWDAYKSHVTPYELERYLPIL